MMVMVVVVFCLWPPAFSQHGKRYFAVARAANDGHAFTFSYLDSGAPIGGDMSGEG